MEKQETVGVVREREKEREHNLEKVSFFCEAKKRYKQAGITLVALVITIIVIIILSTVTISTVFRR